MKLRQIEFVVTVAREQSFSRAAEICHATQPSLSSAVAQIEEELGAKLFARTTRNVALTPFGRHILPHLESVLSARDEVTAAAAAFHNPARKLLRLGFSPLVDMWMLTGVTDPFCRLHQGVEVFFKECLLDDLAGRLESGAIDLTILPRDSVPDGMQQAPFYSDPLYYLPQSGHSAEPPAALYLADLPHDPVIMTAGGCGLNRSLEVLFEAEGISPPAYPGYALSYQVIQEWTWLGLGAGILPRAKLLVDATGAVPLLRATGTPARFEFVWAWHGAGHRPDHVAAFLDHVRDQRVKPVQSRAG